MKVKRLPHSQALELGVKATLILTDSNNADALAAGLKLLGKRNYGVFPLLGGLPNVSVMPRREILENTAISKMMQIMGLEYGVEYEDTKTLNYGHVMVMTTKDDYGFQLKGLVINLFYTLWPALLKLPGFLKEFITPIIKAKHKDGRRVETFYTLHQYEEWKKQREVKNWTIKYYEGLGTSTHEEVVEYLRDIENHQKHFVWENDEDGAAIALAFNRWKSRARKTWVQQFEPGRFLDDADRHIKYRDFVYNELILFSVVHLQRSIPSMVDGLKPSQRKILFCSFKRNLINELRVSRLCGYVTEHSAYHHNECVLARTIIAMAQDYVGSNNINLLLPNGQFGTRDQGGKDHAKPTDIYTQLAPVTRFLFPKADDILLNYINEEGQSIEPTWYMPIIPMVLVNGSEGIGTGWRSYVPNYNPFDIVENIRHLLNDEPMEAMHPWYKGFTGSIEKHDNDDTSAYRVSGNLMEVDENTLMITELPIRKCTKDYNDFLISVSIDNDKSTDPFIKEFHNDSVGDIVCFSVSLSEESLPAVKKKGLLKKLRLSTSISTVNMHLFDSRGVLKKYDTPEQILEDFFYLRLEFYDKRKKALLAVLEKEMLRCENMCRFIQCVLEGSITVMNKKITDLFLELKAKGFTLFPKKENAPEVSVAGLSNGAEDSETSPNGYEYLLSLNIGTLTLEKLQELRAEREKCVAKIEDLKSTSVKSLWMRDLDDLEAKLIEELMKYEENWDANRHLVYERLRGKEPAKGKALATKVLRIRPIIPCHSDDKLKAFLRIRPIIPKLKSNARPHTNTSTGICIHASEDLHSVIVSTPQPLQATQRRKFDVYEGFSYVFSAESSQNDVYGGMMNPLVEDFLKGKSGLLAALGPSGPGKTHIVFGCAREPGMVPLALRRIFSQDESRAIYLSMFEISERGKSEKMVDLLHDGGCVRLQHSVLEGLQESVIYDAEQAESLITNGMLKRATTMKNSNNQSSRSQCIINIRSGSKQGGEEVDGNASITTLTIVDLAGSERENKTVNQGARLLESNFINNTDLFLTVKPGVEDCHDTLFLLRQASPFAKIEFNTMEEPVNMTDKRTKQALPQTGQSKEMISGNNEISLINEGETERCFPENLHQEIPVEAIEGSLDQSIQDNDVDVLSIGLSRMGIQEKMLLKGSSSKLEVNKERMYTFMQGLSKALWNVLKQYKEKLQMVEIENCHLKDSLSNAKKRILDLEHGALELEGVRDQKRRRTSGIWRMAV